MVLYFLSGIWEVMNYLIFCFISDGNPHLNNIFNGLPVWLAIFDNCFMVACLFENIWRHYGMWWHYIFDIGYCFVLYPFKNFALTCITNTQVALSIERFKAIRWVNIKVNLELNVILVSFLDLAYIVLHRIYDFSP